MGEREEEGKTVFPTKAFGLTNCVFGPISNKFQYDSGKLCCDRSLQIDGVSVMHSWHCVKVQCSTLLGTICTTVEFDFSLCAKVIKEVLQEVAVNMKV